VLVNLEFRAGRGEGRGGEGERIWVFSIIETRVQECRGEGKGGGREWRRGGEREIIWVFSIIETRVHECRDFAEVMQRE
jgi:hypothetical protein